MGILFQQEGMMNPLEKTEIHVVQIWISTERTGISNALTGILIKKTGIQIAQTRIQIAQSGFGIVQTRFRIAQLDFGLRKFKFRRRKRSNRIQMKDTGMQLRKTQSVYCANWNPDWRNKNPARETRIRQCRGYEVKAYIVYVLYEVLSLCLLHTHNHNQWHSPDMVLIDCPGNNFRFDNLWPFSFRDLFLSTANT